MRITSILVPKNKCLENGLEDISMDHLKQLVLVVGKNGAGKSRLLAKVKSAVEQQVLPSEVAQLQQNIANCETNSLFWHEEISRFRDPNHNPQLVEPERSQQIALCKQNCENFQQTMHQCKERLSSSFIKYNGDITNRNVIHFVPKNLNLVDSRSLNPLDVESRARSLVNVLGIDSLSEWVLSRIQDLHTQYWNATHPGTKLDPEKINTTVKSYQELQKIVKELLGAEFGNDERGHATLFDFPIGAAQLSDGQKVLLQLAVALHAHSLKLSETILLLDEPENHLHPAAIIDVIEKLKLTLDEGQIWVATHSISIIAHFAEEASLYYLEAGKLSKAGKGKTDVLASLLGDDERVRRQAEFLEEPVTHAMNTYSAQCLMPPAVVTTGTSDPQMAQIRDALFSLSEGKLKVLDFGAGKGRLITNLVENSTDLDSLKTRLNYVALDCDLANRVECEGQIARLYDNAQHRWFQSYPNLLEQHNKASFDVIVMTNVLHEISPKEWLKFFGPTGELTELLTEDGQLLLVEDQRIPIGETAHEFGFIVLDTIALKDLCKILGSEDQIIQNTERDGRLKAHLIPKTYLKRFDTGSILKALETHCRHAKSEINVLRSSKDKSKAKLFAFWVHQYANANLAIESMNSS